MLRYTYRTFLLLVGLFFLVPIFSYAAQLQQISDKISTSVIGSNTTHQIEFVSTNEIPAGSEIRIRFNGNQAPFVFSSNFDYTNLDLSIDRGSGFEDYSLDSFSDSATSSAYLYPFGDGEIGIRLAYDEQFSVPSNSRIKINVGANPIDGYAILNPVSIGSHMLTISTRNPSDELIDTGKAMIATIPAINMTSRVVGKAPIITNGLPKGLIPGSTKKVFISAETNIPSFCRYSLTPNITYENMPAAQRMVSVNFNKLHSLIVNVTEGTTYTYYIRCFSKYGLEANTEDYKIEFEVGVTSIEYNPPPPPPGTQAGNNSGGGNMLEQSNLTITGYTFPGATVKILMDGKEFKTITADSQGNYSVTTEEIDRGTYTFAISSSKDGSRSAVYTTTIYMNGATRNNIGPVYLSPIITSKTQRVDLGAPLLIFGKAVPLYLVQAIMVNPKDPLKQPYSIASTTANGSGEWSLNIDTSKLAKGTFSVITQTIVPRQGNSQFSPEFLVGVGQKAEGDNKVRADINGDGKINIADLSIMLFSWKKSNASADINIDGIVNITDFSIMLSAWTG